MYSLFKMIDSVEDIICLMFDISGIGIFGILVDAYLHPLLLETLRLDSSMFWVLPQINRQNNPSVIQGTVQLKETIIKRS